MREELQPLGLDLVIGFDGADLVEEQIDRLGWLGASGFAISLVVLFLFLREWRAVAVVGVAVPVSLLAALAMLYLVGQSLNLITLFGLALAVGLLVDNSIVVYEAVQRRLERGVGASVAVQDGLRRTVRAIVAASACTSIVFLPARLIDFDDTLGAGTDQRGCAVDPVATGSFAAGGRGARAAPRAPAGGASGVARLARARQRRAEHGDLVPPERARLLFGGILAGALRQPSAWIAGTATAVLITAVVAVPWVSVQSTVAEASDGDSVQLDVRFASGQGSLAAVSSAIGRLERAVPGSQGCRARRSDRAGGRWFAHHSARGSVRAPGRLPCPDGARRGAPRGGPRRGAAGPAAG